MPRGVKRCPATPVGNKRDTMSLKGEQLCTGPAEAVEGHTGGGGAAQEVGVAVLHKGRANTGDTVGPRRTVPTEEAGPGAQKRGESTGDEGVAPGPDLD